MHTAHLLQGTWLPLLAVGDRRSDGDRAPAQHSVPGETGLCTDAAAALAPGPEPASSSSRPAQMAAHFPAPGPCRSSKCCWAWILQPLPVAPAPVVSALPSSLPVDSLVTSRILPSLMGRPLTKGGFLPDLCEESWRTLSDDVGISPSRCGPGGRFSRHTGSWPLQLGLPRTTGMRRSWGHHPLLLRNSLEDGQN